MIKLLSLETTTDLGGERKLTELFWGFVQDAMDISEQILEWQNQ